MAGTTALVPWMMPCRLTSTILRVTASGSSRIEPSGMMPALLTSTSTGPTSAVSRRNSSHEVRSVTSSSAPTTRPPARWTAGSAEISAATDRTSAASRSPIATRAPWRANRSAVARPMPRAPPVTRTERVLRSRVMRRSWEWE